MTRTKWACLRSLERSDHARLEKLATEVRFRPGDRLVDQGKPLDVLLLLLDGRVSVRQEYQGAHIDVAVLGPGEVVGEISFVTGDPPSATVVAGDDVRCAQIHKQALSQAIQDDAGFASRFYASLALLMARRLRVTTARLPRLDSPPPDRKEPRQALDTQPREALPEFLRDAVEHFKKGMRSLETSIEKHGPEPDDQDRVSTLVSGLKAGLSKAEQALLHDGRSPRVAGEFVFRETFPFFMLSSLIDRIFTKPRGKAIDLVALEHIYRGRGGGRGYLGRLIDYDFLHSPSCMTLRERRKEIAGMLRRVHGKRSPEHREFSVTSLMSGIAAEFFDFVDNTAVRKHLRATLLDDDLEALSLSDHLARKHRLRHQILLARENVRALVVGERETQVPPEQDVIYSGGVLDVLDDADVVPLLNWVFDHLKPGGFCVLGNYGASNPDRPFMAHILDWHAVHRSVDDLVRLFAASRFGSDTLKVRVQVAGASLLATCIRPA